MDSWYSFPAKVSKSEKIIFGGITKRFVWQQKRFLVDIRLKLLFLKPLVAKAHQLKLSGVSVLPVYTQVLLPGY
jgi:hypothetical protein